MRYGWHFYVINSRESGAIIGLRARSNVTQAQKTPMSRPATNNNLYKTIT